MKSVLIMTAFGLLVATSTVADEPVTYNVSDDTPSYESISFDFSGDSTQKQGKHKGHKGKGCSCYLFGPDEAWTLCPGDNCHGLKIGGWTQTGYHTEGENGDGTGLFNNRPNQVQAQQMWIYAEKAVDTGGCGFDWGGRVDYVYGTDGPDTQAFGNPFFFRGRRGKQTWDNEWDKGGFYGQAIPQLYGEVGYNNVTVKVGHFYTIIGYEVVTAPDNFFYSHSRTMVLNEPFTHTGVLAEYAYDDCTTIWAGWTLGWDTGFDSDGGNSYLGGVSRQLTDSLNVTWTTVAGDFGFDTSGTGSDSDAYMTSLVVDWNVTDSLEYVFQFDYQGNQRGIGRNGVAYDVNNYVFYAFNDCLKAGLRGEYFNQGGWDTGEVTLGLNYWPMANMVFRPEVRFDFTDGQNDRVYATIFGIDCITTF
jgi:hypothetical protein